MTTSRYHRIFFVYLAAVAAFLLYVGLDGFRHHDRWVMGDWITNYAGGFIRRGLTGQLALDLSHLPLHLSLYFWAFLLELLCYAAIFGTIIFLLRPLSWRLWMIALVYSPATLSFTLFDPSFAFRKEILFLALLGLLIVGLSVRAFALHWLSALLTLAMVALVLSHEGMFFYYPYIVCAFMMSLQSVRRALLAAAPAAIAGTVAFGFAASHTGGLYAASHICTALGGSDLNYEPCSGAIVYMTKSAAAAHLDVLSAIAYWHLKFVMPFLLVMALAPIAFGMIGFRRIPELRFSWWSLVLCSSLAWLVTLPLFVYAFDWNRWIYIHAFSCLMLMLMMERQHQGLTGATRHAAGAAYPQPAILPARNPARALAVLLLIFSVCGWQLSFYHHFPLPGENLVSYLSKRIHGTPLHNKLDFHPQIPDHP